MRSIRGLAVVGAAIVAAGLASAVPAAATTTRQWAAVVSIANHQAVGKAVVVSPDGGTVFVTSTVTNENVDEGFGETMAYNAATGATVWQDKLVLTKSYYETALTSIAVSPDGSTVFVTGLSGNGIKDNGFYQVIVAYNAATGAELWELTGTTPIYFSTSPVTVSPDSSTVYVTNGVAGTAAYDAATGAELWANTAGGTASVLSADGSTLYTTSYGADGVTQAISTSTGVSQWADPVGAYTGYGSPTLSPDGSTLYVTGGVGTGNPGSDAETFVTVAYATATGAQLWSQTTASSTNGGGGMGVAETSTGSAVIVSDWTENETKKALTTGWVTDALDPATGAVLWTRTTRAKYPDTDFGSALALSPDGSTAYVLGYTNNDKTTVYRVTGYDTATGASVYSATYDGRTSNFATAMAISPSGSQLFVTGASTRPYPHLQDVIATVGFSTSAS
jgi:hypothetical protein